MRHFLLLCFFCLSFSFLAQAQAPCGTVSYRSDWLKKYQANPTAYFKNDDSLLVVPLTIHIVGTDEGEGYISQAAVLETLCELNSDFEAANIQFQRKGDWNYLDNSSYHNHASVLDGAEMMFDNNIENTLNIYFVQNPAGNCGYNLPYAGIAMRNSCSGAGFRTISHEVGHAFTIPHPFIGWEGGVGTNNDIPHDYSDPAPEKVYYDYTYFQDTLILDTVIIDTALVELVDHSNCAEAADGFCDTDPDYLGVRWNCVAGDQSGTEQTDPTGAKFTSDGTLIMGYSNDGCQGRFTVEQIAAMRANLFDVKDNILDNADPLAPALAEDGPILIYPQEDDIPSPDFISFEWEEVAGAEAYIFELSKFASFTPASTTTIDAITTSVDIAGLEEDRKYYWRVRAYNSSNFCVAVSERVRFDTGFSVDTREISQINALQILPNPLSSQDQIIIDLNLANPLTLNFQINNLLGQSLLQQAFRLSAGNQQLRLDHQLTPGTYFLQVQQADKRNVYRLVVQ